jgi:YVTN family beta-propeller protein
MLSAVLLSAVTGSFDDELLSDPASVSSEGSEAVPIAATWLTPRAVLPFVGRPVATASAGYTGAGSLSASSLSLNAAPEGDMPRALAFLPDGSAVAIANRDTDTITFLDVASRTITDTVMVGDFPVDVAVAPDGSVVVVPCVFDDSVAVIDVATRSLLGMVAVTGTQPFAVAITPDSSTAIVSVINDGVSSGFSVIHLATLTETSSFPSSGQGVIGFFFTPESGINGNIFSQFALTPDGTTVVLPDRAGNAVRLYDVATGTETDTLATADAPISIDISADGTTAVLGHQNGVNVITEIDLTAPAVTGSFATSALQGQIVRITPDKTHAMAAISNNMIFVNLTTGVTTATVSTGIVGDIVISFDGQYAFVSNAVSRVIDIASQSQVAALSLAPCVDAVASPVEHRVVALNNRFREDANVYSTNGAASFVEGRALSGVPPEGDAPRSIAITPDGLTAVVAHNTSRSAAILDLFTGTVRAYVDTGDRCLGVAVTPDGQTAVVCNGDDNTVSIIDLGSDTTVAQLNVSTRPADVAISPDGSTAYVTTVASSDRVHFIDLNGAASSVSGSLLAGQMGSIGYSYSVVSGIAASPDGSVVAVCISFDDELLIIDAATQLEVARVNVGDFPIQVSFTADGSKAYVVNSFSDSVSVVSINGAASSLAATIASIEFPLVNLGDDTGTLHFVGNFDGNDPRMAVIDTASDTVLTSVALPGVARAAAYSPTDAALFIATTDGQLVKLAVAGAASAVVDAIALVGSPSDLAFSDALGLVVCPEPGVTDSVDLVDVRPGPWTDLGSGLAGTHGVPTLTGIGDLTGGLIAGATLTGALENAGVGLVLGFSQLNAPFKGGVLVPDADVIITGLFTNGAGVLVVSGPWPVGLPPNVDFFLQEWIFDPVGPVGFAASNGLKGTTP